MELELTEPPQIDEMRRRTSGFQSIRLSICHERTASKGSRTRIRGTIILNRPAKRNAYESALLDELNQAFNDLHLERHVRAVILTGAGSAFSAGMDLAEMLATSEQPDPHAQDGTRRGSFPRSSGNDAAVSQADLLRR